MGVPTSQTPAIMNWCFLCGRRQGDQADRIRSQEECLCRTLGYPAAIANTSIAEFCPSHQKQRCPQVSARCRRIVNLYGRPLSNLRQGMDTKRALSLIDSICRCGGVVWCPLWCPLSPRNRVHSSEKVELDEQSEICEIVHSA